MDTNKTILHKDLSYEVMAAVFEVHNHLGPGFLEKVYEKALLLEFESRGLIATSQRELSVYYKKHRYIRKLHYILDNAMQLLEKQLFPNPCIVMKYPG